MATEMQTLYTATSPAQISHASPAVDEFISKYSSAMSSSSVVSPGESSQKRRRNVLQRFVDRVRLEYYRYEVTYGIYTMTTSEKVVSNTFVVVVLSLLLWTILFYCPSLLYRKLSRLVWLLTGHSGEEMSVVWTAFDTHNDAFSSSVSASSALNF